MLVGLAYIASGATGIARGRVNWVVAGIALRPILDLTWAHHQRNQHARRQRSVPLLDVQDWTVALLPWFGLAGSIFVVYGFLSERVVDFRFAIGRAAIYGGVTAIMLALLRRSSNGGPNRSFESTRPAIYVSLFAALLIGFTLNALHGRIENFLNTFFFRDQRRAEEALRHAARALANTSSEKTLVEFLVEEPVRVLGLTSAALFLAHAARAERSSAPPTRGWTRKSRIHRCRGSAHRRAARRPRADRARRPAARRNDLPGGAKAPSLVVPLLMRGSVFGFVFYGPRSSGMPLQADERRFWKRSLAARAPPTIISMPSDPTLASPELESASAPPALRR